MLALEASLATPYKSHRRKRPMRELDVPASRPALHAPGRVLALRHIAETSRGRLLAPHRSFEGGKREPRLPRHCVDGFELAKRGHEATV